jgi:ATP synthase F0 subunit b
LIGHFTNPALLFLAQAAEHQAESFWTNAAWWRPLNLLIFLAFLIYLLRNKIRIGEVFDKRAAGIRKQLEEAQQARAEAEQKLAEVEARLNRLDEEVADIKAESERESAREMDRIMKSAAADAEKIGQTAQREIEGSVKAAKSDLRAFVAEQSAQLAQSMIHSDMKPDDNSRLMGKYIDELGGVSK